MPTTLQLALQIFRPSKHNTLLLTRGLTEHIGTEGILWFTFAPISTQPTMPKQIWFWLQTTTCSYLIWKCSDGPVQYHDYFGFTLLASKQKNISRQDKTGWHNFRNRIILPCPSLVPNLFFWHRLALRQNLLNIGQKAKFSMTKIIFHPNLFWTFRRTGQYF